MEDKSIKKLLTLLMTDALLTVDFSSISISAHAETDAAAQEKIIYETILGTR